MNAIDADARRQLLETADRFVRREIGARRRDEENGDAQIPWETVRRAGEAGFLTAPLGEERGGIGLDLLSESLLWERLAAGDAATALLLGVHGAALRVLAEVDESAEVRDWMDRAFEAQTEERPPLLGVALPAPVSDVREPGGEPGSRTGRNGGQALPSGTLLCLPAPPVPSRVLLLTPAGEGGSPALLWLRCEALTHTLRVEPSHPGSGLLGFPTARAGCGDRPWSEPPALLCRGDRAAALGGRLLEHLRRVLGAVQTGNAAAAWGEARAYASERVQTGRVLAGHQEVRKMLARMETGVEAGRSFVYRVAAGERPDLGGEGDPVHRLARQAERFCGTVAESVCLDAVQVLGGYGYMKDYGVEKRLRDCKTLQALLGSWCEDWLGE